MNSLKYLAAFTIPLSAYIGIGLGGYWSFTTPVYAFLIIPILETALSQDPKNLPVESRESTRINPIYDLMLYANIPIVFFLIWVVGAKVSGGSPESL